MILSDKTLKRLINIGELVVSPLDEEIQIQPASIDIRLGNTFATVSNSATSLSLTDEVDYDVVTKYEYEEYVLRPKSFVLATTKEYIKMPDNLTAFVEGRSSIGRLGLFIQNAGWVDPGFEGEITLELFNASDTPIVLDVGRRVGQLVFSQLDDNAERPYRGKYQGQKGATGSRVHLDVENNTDDF